MDKEQQEFMDLAYKEALIAFAVSEIPVGAIIVSSHKVISAAHNKCYATKDPTGHAEMLALRQALTLLDTRNLSSCQIYITLEPCIMCLGGMINSHLKDIYFGALDSEKGAFTHYGVSPSADNIQIHYLKDQRCGELLTNFFKSTRK